MALFRPIKRMLSPRETERFRGHEDTPPDTPLSGGGRTSRTGEVDSVVIDNAIYSEPTPLDRVEQHHHRLSDDPPLPPRPLSGGGSAENETYYQAPVDTLGRSANVEQQRSSSTRERAQERERRQMNMHERTLNQIQGAAIPVYLHHHGHHHHQGGGGGGLGHRRTRSGGHLIDNEEYSTPWDVQGEQRRRGSGLPLKPPRASRKPIPATPSDGSDNIIPLSPTPILSSSHERSQSASPVPPRSPVQTSPGGDAEYDDPWDVRNRKISQAIPGRHHTHSVHDRRSPPLSHGGGVGVGVGVGEHRSGVRHTVGSRTEHSRQHLEEVRPTRALSDRNNHRSGSGVLESPDPFRTHSVSHSNPNSPRSSSMCAPSHPIQRRPLPEEPGTGSAVTGPPQPSALPSVANSTRTDQPSVLFDSNLAMEEQL